MTASPAKDFAIVVREHCEKKGNSYCLDKKGMCYLVSPATKFIHNINPSKFSLTIRCNACSAMWGESRNCVKWLLVTEDELYNNLHNPDVVFTCKTCSKVGAGVGTGVGA